MATPTQLLTQTRHLLLVVGIAGFTGGLSAVAAGVSAMPAGSVTPVSLTLAQSPLTTETPDNSAIPPRPSRHVGETRAVDHEAWAVNPQRYDNRDFLLRTVWRPYDMAPDPRALGPPP